MKVLSVGTKNAALMLALVAMAAGGGCGWMRGKTGYELSPENRPLEIPPDLDTPSVDPAVRVPPLASARSSQAASAAFTLGTNPERVYEMLNDVLTQIPGLRVNEAARVLKAYNVTFEGEVLLVRVSPEGEGSRVSAVTQDGREAGAGAGAKLLGILKTKL
jgi:hypothetical protein